MTWPTSTPCRPSSPIRFKCPFSRAGSRTMPCVRKLLHFLISPQRSPLRGTLVSDPRRLLVCAFHFTRAVPAAGVALTQLSEQDTLSVEDSINRFIASIIPVHQMGAIHANDRHHLIVVHTLVQAALIRLYYHRGEVDQLWNEKCLHAARGMLLVIGQVSEMDIEFLDPIVGVSPPRVPKSLVAYQLEILVLLGLGGASLYS